MQYSLHHRQFIFNPSVLSLSCWFAPVIHRLLWCPALDYLGQHVCCDVFVIVVRWLWRPRPVDAWYLQF